MTEAMERNGRSDSEKFNYSAAIRKNQLTSITSMTARTITTTKIIKRIATQTQVFNIIIHIIYTRAIYTRYPFGTTKINKIYAYICGCGIYKIYDMKGQVESINNSIERWHHEELLENMNTLPITFISRI